MLLDCPFEIKIARLSKAMNDRLALTLRNKQHGED
jgi:hypothetical protein